MFALHLMIVLGCIKKGTVDAVSSAEQTGDKPAEHSTEEIQESNGEVEEDAKEDLAKEDLAKEEQDESSKKHIDLPPGVVMGALDKSLIDAEIGEHMSNIKSCYSQELQSDPSLNGRVVVKFVIAKDGTVSKADPKEDSVGSEKVTQCVLEQFSKMQFPEPKGGGIVIVSYPFVFSPD